METFNARFRSSTGCSIYSLYALLAVWYSFLLLRFCRFWSRRTYALIFASVVSVVCELPDEAEADVEDDAACEDDDTYEDDAAWDEAAECAADFEEAAWLEAADEAAECAVGFEEAAWLEAADEAAASDVNALASPLSALLSASSEDASGSSSGCGSGSLVESAALAALEDTGASACASELLTAALAVTSSVGSAFAMCSPSGTAATRSSATAAISCFVFFCIFYQTLPSSGISRRRLQSISSIPFHTPEHNP